MAKSVRTTHDLCEQKQCFEYLRACCRNQCPHEDWEDIAADLSLKWKNNKPLLLKRNGSGRDTTWKGYISRCVTNHISDLSRKCSTTKAESVQLIFPKNLDVLLSFRRSHTLDPTGKLAQERLSALINAASFEALLKYTRSDILDFQFAIRFGEIERGIAAGLTVGEVAQKLQLSKSATEKLKDIAMKALEALSPESVRACYCFGVTPERKHHDEYTEYDEYNALKKDDECGRVLRSDGIIWVGGCRVLRRGRFIQISECGRWSRGDKIVQTSGGGKHNKLQDPWDDDANAVARGRRISVEAQYLKRLKACDFEKTVTRLLSGDWPFPWPIEQVKEVQPTSHTDAA